MKKKYFTFAGIIAAILLVAMFVAICLSSFPFPFMPPTASIDPVTNASVDENNMLIITGTTTLTNYANLSVTIAANANVQSQDTITTWTNSSTQAVIIPAVDGGQNRWKGEFALANLAPAEYMITVATYTISENHTYLYGAPLATGYFTLGDENAGPNAIHKRVPATTQYIRINPVRQTDSHIKITGITSLLPTTPLEWNLYAVTNATVDHTADYTGKTLVTEGTEGVNRWTVLFENTTPRPGQYVITLTGNPAGTATFPDTISASAGFDLPLDSVITGTTHNSTDYISIDTLPKIHPEEVYVITGTTSLSPGQGLTMNVYPAFFEAGSYNFSLDAKDTDINNTLSETGSFSGATGGTVIVNGTGGENLWSFDLQTYKFSPGEYILNISNDDYDRNTFTTLYGDTYSSKRLTITEGTA